MSKRFHVICGIAAWIDEEDEELLSRYKWRIEGGYAVTSVLTRYGLRTMSMHRMVMKNPKGQDIHHKNNCRLDNRKFNLEPKDRAPHFEEHRKERAAYYTQKYRKSNPKEKTWKSDYSTKAPTYMYEKPGQKDHPGQGYLDSIRKVERDAIREVRKSHEKG